jgi:hypothetical protein
MKRLLLCAVFLCVASELKEARGIFIDGLAPRDLNLAGMSERAAAIVEVTVESFFPETAVSGGWVLERDARLRVMRIFKGPSDLTEIVVSEATDKRCSGCPLAFMQQGHRYILFLQTESEGRVAILPGRAGLPRYGIFLAKLGN